MAQLSLDTAAWTSPWRRRHLGEKALLSLGLLGVALVAPQPIIAFTVAVIACGTTVGFAQVPWRIYARAAAGPMAFVVIGLLGVAVSIGSSPPVVVLSWGPFFISPHGVTKTIEVLARSVGAVSALLLLAATTPMTDIVQGLRRVKVPEAVIDIAAVMYRMVFSLLDAVASIREAQTSRLGYSSTKSSYRSFALLLSSVLQRAWHQASRLEAGLAGRGYDARLTTLTVQQPISWFFVAASTAVLCTLAAWCAIGVFR